MELKFEVRLSVRDMYLFLLRHAFAGFSGWFGVLFAIALFVLAGVTRDRVSMQYTALYIAVGAVVLLYPFVSFYFRARRQVLKNEMFAKPLEYTLTDEGIEIAQEEERAEVKWDGLSKAVETKTLFIVYVNIMRAFIWPKGQLADKEPLVREVLHRKLGKNRNGKQARNEAED